MRRNSILALALGLAVFAGSARAEICVGTADAGECPQTAGAVSSITTNTTWCGAGPDVIVLNQPVFVSGGATLTIGQGCRIHGQPRQAAVAAGVTAGTPGALIITQTGKINAVGTPTNPIVFTTAAVDAVAPFGVADNVDGNASFLDPYPGGNPSLFLDDDPLGAPLSPLNANGVQNVALWGGVVLLGNAPTNQSNFAGQGHGTGLVEGLTIPGFPAASARFGGVNPHDSSGRMRYASIRHAGDEIGNSNELNCLTMGGLGDGTDLSFIDCYANFDDGFEFFGGTVDTHHLVASYLGDDMFDLDQGYTGVSQFWFGVQGNFNQNSGASYGTSSGDKGGEWDGDDYVFNPATPDLHNVSTRFQVGSIPAPLAAIENTPWPLSNPAVFNVTIIGPAADGAANPAVSPLSAGALAGKRGVDMRNGFAGRLINGMVVNYGTGVGLDVRNGDGAAPGFQTETNNVAVLPTAVGGPLVAVVTSTFDDVAAMGAAENTALGNGDAIRVGLGAPSGAASQNCVNNALFAGLAQENNLLIPTGSPSNPGKLDPSDPALPAAIDPDPLFGSCGLNGVPPRGPGLDGGATYRGAFQAGEANWTTGWSILNLGGLLEDN